MEEQRTFFQKVVLIILAAMIVVFGAVTAYCQTIEGIRLRDSFLRKREVADADCFTGKVEGEQVTILRWYGDGSGTREVTLQVGERIHDTYAVYLGEPMIPLKGTVATLASALLEVPTVRIAKNGTVTFEGGYQASSGMFYTSEGEWESRADSANIYVSGGDFWKGYTMPKGTLVKIALDPELEDRGDWRLYGLMVFFTLMLMVDVAFPYTLFRWRHHRWVKDPEPTDDYMSIQHLCWVICPILLLVFYIFAATTTMAVT